MKEKPVYLATGFIESGKTTLLKEMLTDEDFLEGERVLIICTEEGSESYDEDFLRENNAELIMVSDPKEMDRSFFDRAVKERDFDLVFFELNGMWEIEKIYSRIPPSWPIVQIFTTIDATTFEMYLSNMRSVIMNIIKMSDAIIMNRCTEQSDLSSYRRTLKGANPKASIIFEDVDGNINNNIQDILPYDYNSDPIVIDTPDFGIFILDLQEHKERYDGKNVVFTAMAYSDPYIPEGHFYAGRFAMACCAQDAQFVGFDCIYENAGKVIDKKFYTISGTMRFEMSPVYVQDGPVIYVKDIKETEEPDDKFVYFN